ncbi:MAG: hypothetical protein ABIR81_08220 [Ginsengibacter sp.]
MDTILLVFLGCKQHQLMLIVKMKNVRHGKNIQKKWSGHLSLKDLRHGRKSGLKEY